MAMNWIVESFWRLGISVAFAQGQDPPGALTLTDPLGGKTFPAVIEAVSDALARIAIPIVAVIVLYGAFQIMTAGGSAEKVSSGRKTILYAVVGYAIVLLASSVVPLIRDIIK